MIVLFRSCEANLSPGSMGEGKEYKPRWNGKYKHEILRKCYMSVVNDLTPEDKLFIIDDLTTKETIEWMRRNCPAQFQVKTITPLHELRKKHPYPEYHPVITNCCPELMELLVEIAEHNPDEIIYMCEDDYLHVPRAIEILKATFSQGYEGFYAPYDYPDRYYLDNTKQCELHIGPGGHLRTIPSATLTIAALGKTWLRFKFELLRAGVFADDSWTWKAFKQVGALCPIPGHATHLQEGCVTPVTDWNKIYNDIDIEEEDKLPYS